MMKAKKLFFNIITSGIRNKDIATTHKIMLLNTLLLFGAITMGLTLVYRLFNTISIPFLIIDISTSLSFLISFFLLRKYKNIEQISLFSTLIIIIFMLGFIISNKTHSLGIVWTYVVPIYVIFLNGYKKGAILTAIFYIGMTFIYIFDVHNWQQMGWDNLSLIRYIITSTVLVAICIAYDYVFTQFQQELKKQSRTDSLTGINNRRSIDDILNIEIESIKRNFSNLSFTIFDIDDFKMVNDKYGHLVGDRVLKELTKITISNIRKNDTIGRWGGEEFCIISTNTSLDQAIVLLERLRKNISNHDFKLDENITCSFGVSILTKDFDRYKLIKNADAMLYRAKNGGKNIVCYK